MKTSMRNLIVALALLALSTLHPRLSTCFAQGSLTPPGAPAPTMLTLSQIEPLTPVDAAHTGSGGGSEFLITQPGSYYLTTNLVGVSGLHGINISANNVTLDLNGFSLLGGSGTMDGIYIHGGYSNITVRHGSVSGWSANLGMGIACFATNVVLEDLIVATADMGIYWDGYGGIIRDCVVNGNSEGIQTESSGVVVTGNVLAGNTAGIFILGNDNLIKDNYVTGNGGFGIEIVNNPLVTNNIVIRNTVVGSGANNYSFNTTQIVGPIITNAVSGIITNSNPSANYSF